MVRDAWQGAADRDQEPLHRIYRQALEEQRLLRTPSVPPPFDHEMANIGVAAVVVAAGALGLRLLLFGDQELRGLCVWRLGQEPRRQHERVMGPSVRPEGGGAALTTSVARANAVALVGRFCSGAVGTPGTRMAFCFFQAFFRPLLAAYAAGGLDALERAMDYLSCCDGAEHAAYIAFGPAPGGPPGGPGAARSAFAAP
jgi:hypothetical protein